MSFFKKNPLPIIRKRIFLYLDLLFFVLVEFLQFGLFILF